MIARPAASRRGQGRRSIRLATAVYDLLLGSLPATFRRRHGGELRAVFEELSVEAWGLSRFRGLIGCLARESLDLLATAARLRLAGLSSELASSASPPPGPSMPRPGGSRMDTLRQDIAFAARSLTRRPGFTAVAVITLALGIGATTAIFSVVNGVLLRPLPYPESERITMFWRTLPSIGWPRGPMSFPNFEDFRRSATSFEGMAAHASPRAAVIGGDVDAEVRRGLPTISGLFSVLGVGAAEGRTLIAADDEPGASPVVVLSHALATRLAAGRGSMVGAIVSIDRIPHTVVGVMPARFAYPSASVEYWVQLRQSWGEEMEDRGTNFLTAIGRLRGGVTIDAAQAEIEGIAARLLRDHPGDNANSWVGLEQRHAYITGNARPVLLMLLAAVGLVLAIACANLANLILARGSGRRREVAVRVALGAGRARIVRQLLTESALLAVAGGLVGVALAYLSTNVLVALGAGSIPRSAEISIDSMTLGVTAIVALASGGIAGLVPAVRSSRPDLQTDLRSGGTGTTRAARHGMQRGLVVAQVALALVLLMGAGLLANSLIRLMTVDAGFDPESVLTVQVAPPSGRYTETGEVDAFYGRLVERVSALPGARRVGAGWALPLTGRLASTSIMIDGHPETITERPLIGMFPVRGDYLRTMGMRLIEGRFITDEDRPSLPDVAVINETMARRFWPGESAVGKRFRRGTVEENEPWITVVGVVADVKEQRLDSVPGLQGYWHQSSNEWARDMSLVIRTSGDPLGLATAVRAAVREIDPEAAILEVETMEQRLSESAIGARFRTMVLLSFAGVACLLALVGIYGVMAFLVAERTREIGLRMALGAQRGDMLRHVLGEGFRLTAVGLAIGLIAALVATRAIQAMLFGIEATDPPTYAAVVLALGTVAMLACYVPAWRASRVDPVIALRAE